MYKCKECGNIDQFEGRVKEEGMAKITQYEDETFTWSYYLNDKDGWADVIPMKCAHCNSAEILKIE
jgi:hypothetical protein